MGRVQRGSSRLPHATLSPRARCCTRRPPACVCHCWSDLRSPRALPHTHSPLPAQQELFEDPVVAADGHSYDRHAIEAWLSGQNTSPMTGAHLAPGSCMAPELAGSRGDPDPPWAGLAGLRRSGCCRVWLAPPCDASSPTRPPPLLWPALSWLQESLWRTRGWSPTTHSWLRYGRWWETTLARCGACSEAASMPPSLPAWPGLSHAAAC